MFPKYRLVLLVLLVFLPSIVFLADYIPNSLNSSSGMKHVTAVSSGDGYNVTMVIGYPSYIVTGQRVPISLDLHLNFSAPYTGISVDDMKVEIRNPSAINGTTNVIEDWQTLSSASAQVGKNYTTTGTTSRVLEVTATYPPSSNPVDLFVPVSKVGVNGASDLTLYSFDGNTTNASPISLSYLDGGTIYQTQLQVIRSTTSLIVYELLAALLVSVFYLRSRSAVVEPADRRYSVALESFRLQRSLAKLEDLLASGKIGQSSYNELRQKYERELAHLGSPDKATS